MRASWGVGKCMRWERGGAGARFTGVVYVLFGVHVQVHVQ